VPLSTPRWPLSSASSGLYILHAAFDRGCMHVDRVPWVAYVRRCARRRRVVVRHCLQEALARKNVLNIMQFALWMYTGIQLACRMRTYTHNIIFSTERLRVHGRTCACKQAVHAGRARPACISPHIGPIMHVYISCNLRMCECYGNYM